MAVASCALPIRLSTPETLTCPTSTTYAQFDRVPRRQHFHHITPPMTPVASSTWRGPAPRDGPHQHPLREECAGTRTAADQHKRTHQIRTLFGKRGGDIAAAGVPNNGHTTNTEVIEQRRDAGRLPRHVVRPGGRRLPQPGRSTRMTWCRPASADTTGPHDAPDAPDP